MVTHRRVNNDICPNVNNVRYVDYEKDCKYKNKIDVAM